MDDKKVITYAHADATRCYRCTKACTTIDETKTCSCRCRQDEELQMQPRRAAADATKTCSCRCSQDMQLQMQTRREAADAAKTCSCRCSQDVQQMQPRRATFQEMQQMQCNCRCKIYLHLHQFAFGREQVHGSPVVGSAVPCCHLNIETRILLSSDCCNKSNQKQAKLLILTLRCHVYRKV